MADTTTISVRQRTKSILAEQKGEDETWDQCLLRLAVEDAQEQPQQEMPPGLERLEDIMQQMPERTAAEVEERMRTR